MLSKFILLAAAALSPGADLPWPPHHVERLGAWIVTHVAELPDGSLRQSICFGQPGVYQLQVRLGMAPLPLGSPEVAGWVMFNGGRESSLLAIWRAAPGEWTLAEGSTVVDVGKNFCGWLTYAASGPATLNHDPRVTSITIVRVGQ